MRLFAWSTRPITKSLRCSRARRQSPQMNQISKKCLLFVVKNLKNCDQLCTILEALICNCLDHLHQSLDDNIIPIDTNRIVLPLTRGWAWYVEGKRLSNCLLFSTCHLQPARSSTRFGQRRQHRFAVFRRTTCNRKSQVTPGFNQVSRQRDNSGIPEQHTLGRAAEARWRSSIGCQLFERIKLNAALTWDAHKQIPGWPLSKFQEDYVSYSHQWWDCVTSQALWNVFFDQWQRLDLLQRRWL